MPVVVPEVVVVLVGVEVIEVVETSSDDVVEVVEASNETPAARLINDHEITPSFSGSPWSSRLNLCKRR